MTRFLSEFGRRSFLHWCVRPTIAAAIAFAPLAAYSDDKDKDKDKKHNEQPAAKSQSQPANKIQSQSGDSKPQSDAANKKTLKAGDFKSLQTEPPAKPLDATNKKTLNPRTLKGLNPQPEPPGKPLDPAKKSVKPTDPKELKTQPELPSKPLDGAGKKVINSGDLKEFTSDPPGKPHGGKSKKVVKPGETSGFNPQPDPPGKLIDAGKKTVKPGDTKGLNPQPEPPSTQLQGANKAIKPGDVKGLIQPVKPAGNFAEQLKSGKFDKVTKGAVAKKLDLHKQLELHQNGDLAHKLSLGHKLELNGGWKNHHWFGVIGPGYGVGCSPFVYCGPGYFPGHCLCPAWCDWVSWCWWFHCDPIWDPRPWFCRPCIYDPCSVWIVWDYPIWIGLPEVVCGTWVEVPEVVVAAGLDLQLLAVRFVDPGHLDERQGPRYRVWFRNNSPVPIVEPFNVLLMASNSRQPAAGLPQAGVRVTGMKAGEIQSVDIRLPFEASLMARGTDGEPMPFSQLHVLVDSHQEIPEAFRPNNGAVIARGDILPVDPVLFAADSPAAPAGAVINLAGEGFGPEPGQVLVHVGGLELDAEIEGWYDLGIRVRLPRLALASSAEADIVVVRGDTAASNPLAIELTVPVALR